MRYRFGARKHTTRQCCPGTTAGGDHSITAAVPDPVRCTKCRTRFFATASDADVTCDECGKIAESYAAMHARIEEAKAMTSAGVEGFFDEE